MAFETRHQLHFLLVPLMSQSHIIPLTDFAKILSRRGAFVSIVATPLNAIKIKAMTDSQKLNIQTVPIQFPGQEAGLPEGCENLDAIKSPELAGNFFAACEMMESPLEKLIQEMEWKPNCIISSNALPWTQKVARKFNIPGYVFETISCFTLLCSRKISEGEFLECVDVDSDSERFLVPNIPCEIEFTKAQLPETMIRKSNQFEMLIEDIKQAQESARGTLVNSFEELEKFYVEACEKERKNFWCIGPVSLSNKKFELNLIDEHYCVKWLESMNPGSVIYACFGSLCRIPFEQIKEIGFGLESSSYPFVWVIRGLDCSEEVEKWLEDENFEMRIKGRGLVIRGWAPQVLILSHPSVGGFLTHCGWNSTLEGVCAGVPMVTWPMSAEQFYNEKFILQVLRIGVSVGVERLVGFGGQNGKDREIVTGNRVSEAIEKLMDGGEEGEKRRKRALEVANMACKAVEGGSSYSNVTKLIQDVMQQQFY